MKFLTMIILEILFIKQFFLKENEYIYAEVLC